MMRKNTAVWPLMIVVFTLMPVLLLHRHQMERKWDVVVFWTVITFVPVIKMSQRRWSAVDFWVEISLVFLLHLAVLLALFHEIGENVRVPLIFTLPVVWFEITAILKALNVTEKSFRTK